MEILYTKSLIKFPIICGLRFMKEELLPTSAIHYFTSFRLFSTYQSELLYNYKYFIENLIMKLGQDWRIESNLLSQQIISFKSSEDPSKDHSDFNLFNQFLAAYLQDKIGKEYEYTNYCESQVQNKFLQNVNLQFRQESIYNGLTFKTLSLGYCINATEVWNKTFKNPIDKNIKNFIHINPFGKLSQLLPSFQSHSNEKSNSQEFQAKEKKQSTDVKGSNPHVSEEKGEQSKEKINKQKACWKTIDEDILSQRQILKIKASFQKISHTLKKTQVLSCFVSCIDEMHLKNGKRVRIFSISNQFYLQAFIIWLIFNIKMFFSLNFSHYLRYFKSLISQNWKEQYEKPLKKFQSILERQWSKLLKDFTVALHDDQQVLNILVERVKKCMQAEWQSKITSLKDSFQQRQLI